MKKTERLRITFQLTYYLRRRVIRLLTWLEVPAAWAKKHLNDTDAEDPYGRKRNVGPDPGRKERREK